MVRETRGAHFHVIAHASPRSFLSRTIPRFKHLHQVSTAIQVADEWLPGSSGSLSFVHTQVPVRGPTPSVGRGRRGLLQRAASGT